jgi:hypothetical protein
VVRNLRAILTIRLLLLALVELVDTILPMLLYRMLITILTVFSFPMVVINMAVLLIMKTLMKNSTQVMTAIQLLSKWAIP